jgi:hypothetical protein
MDTFFSSQISFQEMAIAFLSAGGEDSVSAVFEGFQQMQSIQLASTHQLYNAYIGRILNAHGAGQVGCRISAVVAAKSNNPGLVRLLQCLTPFYLYARY